MKRALIVFVALSAACLLSMPAQEAATSASRLGRYGVPYGIDVPAIAGVPFSATVVIQTELDWIDEDYTEVHRTINLIARDSQGRTHSEARRLMPESFHGSPELLEVRLFDPATHFLTTYDPRTKTGRREFMQDQPKDSSEKGPKVHIESLGTQIIDGLKAEGTLRTYSNSGWYRIVGGKTEIEDEVWHSDDLKVNLFVHHDDPSSDRETFALSAIKRGEPPVQLFEVPKDCKIVDETSPRGARKPAQTRAGASP